jgi:hypothetical protein
MDDELKKAWQSQASPQRLTLDAALVLNEVRRNERQFAAMIYARDVREVGVALLLVRVWIYCGIRFSHHWTWYLVVPTLLWIAGFMIADRVRQSRRQPEPEDTLRSSIESSLAQVEHQIWLLQNIFWWYLLPPFGAMMIWPAHLAWRSRDDGLDAVAPFAGVAFTYVLVGWFIYWLNQYAVRKALEPRRKELQALLRSLNESEELSS